ncbi:hypothetical protein GUJ93_ZPchr0005g15880 [Zizania palustris]|uniref:Uncharacterized protein n=1 Tax=Zizania palustris TaxID=103762 RepID=A0A8J5SG78_ZIZPA|nr:hypothetical protein GUJ93_ZPchr0005g15880 [Zizania palustris]
MILFKYSSYYKKSNSSYNIMGLRRPKFTQDENESTCCSSAWSASKSGFSAEKTKPRKQTDSPNADRGPHGTGRSSSIALLCVRVTPVITPLSDSNFYKLLY